MPASPERLALILNRNEPVHRFTVVGNDDAGVMVGYVVEGVLRLVTLVNLAGNGTKGVKKRAKKCPALEIPCKIEELFLSGKEIGIRG